MPFEIKLLTYLKKKYGNKISLKNNVFFNHVTVHSPHWVLLLICLVFLVQRTSQKRGQVRGNDSRTRSIQWVNTVEKV
jgi:heme/copper-type cytochrome/quinol oxidase subunit 3